MDIYEVFNELRYHHEDEVVEFKKAENNFDFDDLGKYFSALSNEANLRDKAFAWLAFGVHDKTREILGTSFKNSMKSLQKLKQDLSQHTTDNHTFREIYELKVEGKRVLLFQIPATPRGIPMAWKGHFYARRGESLGALDMGKYEEIRRQVLDVDYARLLTRDKTLSLLDIEMLSRIQMHRPLSKEEIDYLRKRKLVEGRKNALYFAKSVAGATGQKAEYTRNKGFDDEYYRDLIMKALEQHERMSRPEINALLMNKLPEALTEKQKLSKIGHLLTYLRQSGKIEIGDKKQWQLKEFSQK